MRRRLLTLSGRCSAAASAGSHRAAAASTASAAAGAPGTRPGWPAGAAAAAAGACAAGGAAAAWLVLRRPPEPDDAPGDHLADLPALRVDGASVDRRLRLRSGPRGRGLFLAADAEQGAVLLSVPPAAVLSPERAARLLLGAAGAAGEAGQGSSSAAAAEDGPLQWGLLPALLARVRAELEEGRPASFGLGPYVDVLPHAFPSLPVYLAPEEAERELRGTALLPATQQLRARLLADRDAARQALERGGAGDAFPASTWGDGLWLWACGVLLTRGGLGLSLSGGEYGLGAPSLALVPLVDLANCDCRAPACEVVTGPGGEVRLVALRPLSAGTEATFDYGARSHEQTLFTFGYLPDSGELAVTSPLQLACEEGGVRQALLSLLALDRREEEEGQLAGPAPAARLRRAPGGPGTADASELVAGANILEMTRAELKEVAGQVAGSGGLPPHLGREPSPAARRRLLALLEAWSAELARPAGAAAAAAPGDAGEALEPLRRYRAECAALVAEAAKSFRS